jgi:hypothetical protein
MEKHTAIKVYKGLGENLCRSTLLEYIYQQDNFAVGFRPMETSDISEGCRHFLNRGWTDRASGEHPAGEVYDDYRDFRRRQLEREFGSANPKDFFTKKELKSINYGEYTYYAREEDLDPIVTVGRNSIEVSDIINGQRVHRRYIGHNEEEALESFIEDMTTGGL